MSKGASADADRAVVNGAGQAVSALRASVPSAWSVQHARAAIREPVYRTAEDNIDRAVGSAIYRQQNSEIARCFLRMVAAQGIEAGTGETREAGLDAKHESPVADRPCAPTSPPTGEP